MALLAPGTVVGSYRVEGVLGAGGMGVVYEARQLALDRSVALKAVRPELGRDPAFVERFRREGRLQASLHHPNLVEVLEAVETEDGLFLAMRLEPGPTLAELLSAGGLDAKRALTLLEQVASALDAAHAAGLVHRDVKPENILLGEEGEAHLGDFGLTRTDAGTAATATAGELGTLAYVAPEVVGGAPAGPASDVYGFAATAFHCLAGHVPFAYESGAAVLYAHVHEPVPRISERRPGLPAALDELFAAGLAKDPAGRPRAAATFVKQLRRVLTPEVLEHLGAPRSTPPRSGASFVAPSAAPRSWGRVLAGAAACVLAGATVGAVAAALADDDDPGAVPAPNVTAGATALGSALEVAGRTVDCRGRPPTVASPPCSISQLGLPGRRLVVPEDGAIFAWTVRGARGELALQVLRRGEGGASQVARSQYETINNGSTHRFATNLEVQRGDLLALEVTRGAGVGVADAAGARTERWFPTRRGKPRLPADRGPGTGLDVEVLVRADYVPGARRRLPRSVSGAAAASLPRGRRLASRALTFTDGRRVQVVLVELPDHVALDVVRRGRRVARMGVPGLRPGGRLVNFSVLNYDDSEAAGEAGVEWVDENSARLEEHYFGVFPRALEFYD